jgi:restriction system protein
LKSQISNLKSAGAPTPHPALRTLHSDGRKEIQSFVGALAGRQAHKGIFITTNDFAETARNYARSISQKVILLDGDRLADLMMQHNIGVSVSHSYDVKTIDTTLTAGPGSPNVQLGP